MKASGDYIFKEKDSILEYVGDFDGLYQNEVDPWGQASDPVYRLRRMRVIEWLRELAPVDVLDVGCGLGHLTKVIEILVTLGITGVDISDIAIKRAKNLFPYMNFMVMDITKDSPGIKYDVVILNNLLWYILDDLNGALQNAEKSLQSGGSILISQAFIQEQRYGKEVIDGYSGLLRYLVKNGYNVIRAEYYDTGDRKSDGLILIEKRREDEV